MSQKLFYLQDSRDFVGNDVLWWGKAGIGYTTDLTKAEVFSEEYVFKQHHSRSSDVPWPKAYIDTKTRLAVDWQYISQAEAVVFDAAEPSQDLTIDESFMEQVRAVMNDYGFQNREMADRIVALVSGYYVSRIAELPLQPSAPMQLLANKHQGMKVDYSGLLSKASNALIRGIKEPGLAELLRQLQHHMGELGSRYYVGDTAVVDELLQLYCISTDARQALASKEGK